MHTLLSRPFTHVKRLCKAVEQAATGYAKRPRRELAFRATALMGCILLAVSASAQTPSPITYTAFDQTQLTRYPYSGRNVALLLASPNLNVGTLQQILAGLDNAYDYYARATGQTPQSNAASMYQGRTAIAEVPSTCGAGCGYLGFRGIEIASPYFDTLYNEVLDNNQFDQVPFYELGRNFWFYGTKIEFKGADAQTSGGAITTGYAVFMRFMAMDAAGVVPAPFGAVDFAHFRHQVEGLIDVYLATPSLNWSNTMLSGKAPTNELNLGATDLFASIVFRLRAEFGQQFTDNIWKEVAKRPDAITTQDAVDNFVLAASATAQVNLTKRFTDWRWPVSTAANDEALGRFGRPVDIRAVEFYNATLDHYFISIDPNEMRDLDSGVHAGWARTGLSFNAYSPGSAGASPVCRFYIPPTEGDSHFFGRGTAECDATRASHANFDYESPEVFDMMLPAAGVCPPATVPVYRVFSNRSDANHRYTTSRTVRAEMVIKGWLAEGDGPDLVVMCAPS